MPDNEQDYVTQEEIAKELGVAIEKVRPTVTALAGLNLIKTIRSVKDRRFLLVHKDGIPVIRQAIFNS